MTPRGSLVPRQPRRIGCQTSSATPRQLRPPSWGWRNRRHPLHPACTYVANLPHAPPACRAPQVGRRDKRPPPGLHVFHKPAASPPRPHPRYRTLGGATGITRPARPARISQTCYQPPPAAHAAHGTFAGATGVIPSTSPAPISQTCDRAAPLGMVGFDRHRPSKARPPRPHSRYRRLVGATGGIPSISPAPILQTCYRTARPPRHSPVPQAPPRAKPAHGSRAPLAAPPLACSAWHIGWRNRHHPPNPACTYVANPPHARRDPTPGIADWLAQQAASPPPVLPRFRKPANGPRALLGMIRFHRHRPGKARPPRARQNAARGTRHPPGDPRLPRAPAPLLSSR